MAIPDNQSESDMVAPDGAATSFITAAMAGSQALVKSNQPRALSRRPLTPGGR
jgi:hypothetical protein